MDRQGRDALPGLGLTPTQPRSAAAFPRKIGPFLVSPLLLTTFCFSRASRHFPSAFIAAEVVPPAGGTPEQPVDLQAASATSTPLGAIDTTWNHRIPQKPLVQSSNLCQCLRTVPMSLGNSAVQVRKPPLRPTRPTRLQHLPPGQVLQVGNLLNLADNPLSSAQFRQFVAQPRKPTTQGSFIDEA